MTTLAVATLASPLVDKASVLHAANLYLYEMLGNQYHATQPIQTKVGWQCLIQFCVTETGKTVLAGQIDLDGKTGHVIPLGSMTLREIQERVIVRLAKEKGEVARNEDGYILPYLARIKVNGYLTDFVTMFANAAGEPTWHDGDPPRWRFQIVLRLRGQDNGVPFGHVDVDALTGTILPLSNEQISSLQKRANYAAAHLPRSAETPR